MIEHDLAFAAKYIEGLLRYHNGSLARIAKVREARFFYMTKVNELDQQLRQMIKDLEKESQLSKSTPPYTSTYARHCAAA